LALDKTTENVVSGLHKGLGVRKVDLVEELRGSMLGEFWGVTDRDPTLVVLGKAIYRLDGVFRTIFDDDMRRAGPAIYNTLRDVSMHGLTLTERQDRYRREYSSKVFSQRSMSRITADLVAAVLRSIEHLPKGAVLPPIPDQALLTIVRQEAEFADEVSGLVGPAAFSRKVRRSYTAAVDEAAAAFMRLSVVVPNSYTNDLIIARTEEFGDWLCAFSTETALKDHQQATSGQPWSGTWRSELGVDLVQTVTSRWSSVGILVDPPASRSDDATSSLRLPPAVLAVLASRR
jgi:hypothetical protein